MHDWILLHTLRMTRLTLSGSPPCFGHGLCISFRFLFKEIRRD